MFDHLLETAVLALGDSQLSERVRKKSGATMSGNQMTRYMRD